MIRPGMLYREGNTAKGLSLCTRSQNSDTLELKARPNYKLFSPNIGQMIYLLCASVFLSGKKRKQPTEIFGRKYKNFFI